MTKRNAIGTKKCETCKFWHNPDGAPMGLCVESPPVPVVVGAQAMPPPAIVDPKKPPMQQVMPLVLGYYPSTMPEQGCGRWANWTSVH